MVTTSGVGLWPPRPCVLLITVFPSWACFYLLSEWDGWCENASQRAVKT